MYNKRLFWVGMSLSWICIFAVVNTIQVSGSGLDLTGSLVWKLLGRLHPIAVHLPIGVILFAAFLEVMIMFKKHAAYRQAIQLSLLIGLIAGIFSAVSGLMLSAEGDHASSLLLRHQWVAMGVLCLTGFAWFKHAGLLQNPIKKDILSFRILLFANVLLLLLATYFGASLTHGTSYWSTEASTKTTKTLLKNKTTSLAQEPEPALEPDPALVLDNEQLFTNSETSSLEQQADLQLQVRTILAHSCYDCHGPEKVKGDLRLDHIDLIMKGGESGPVVVPGNANASELYKRISLPEGHEDIMPSKGKKLTEQEIRVIALWINTGAAWPDNQQVKKAFRNAALAPRNPALPLDAAAYGNPIDKWTNSYLKAKKLSWPSQTDDRTFIRRVYLDLIGLLPTPKEMDVFLSDKKTDKREQLVRQLLDREDDYAAHWLSFWNDALRNDYTGTGYITGGRFNITNWLYTAIKTNKPFPQFVKELVSPEKESRGFIEGIKWRGEINASQRTEMQAAQNVAQVFLGLNLKCASCHNSFISDWKLTDAYGFANIFSDSSLEINRCDKPTGKFTRPQMLWKDLGKIDSMESRKVKMAQLAEIMVKPENGRLYRTIVNRIWKQMLGRGLVEPVDQMDNQPWSQDLLDWMAFDFQKKGGDIKALIYSIATSKTYQTRSVGLKDPNDIVLQNYTFRGSLRKRITAEQFSDIVGAIIDPIFPDSIMKFKPQYAQGFVPPGGYFARAAFVANNSFLIALGRPNRENVTTGRESQANLLQALELTNGERFNAMLKRGAIKWQRRYPDGASLVSAFYSLSLGRKPSSKEKAVAIEILGNVPSLEGIQDFFWAALLLPEIQIID
jgi:uncharacterized membrane protein/mono/diheme cytochrome c family protein